MNAMSHKETSTIEPECKLCEFWVRKTAKSDIGFCHRYPPVPTDHRGTSWWPQTSEDESCGEFRVVDGEG